MHQPKERFYLYLFKLFKGVYIIAPSQEADSLPPAAQAEIPRQKHREEAIYSIQDHHQGLQALQEVRQEGIPRREIQEEAGNLLVDLPVVGRVDCRVKGACLLVMRAEDRRRDHREHRRGWGRGVGRGASRGLLVLLFDRY